MKINKSIIKEEWVKYPEDEEVEFLIRPFPSSQGLVPPDDMEGQAHFNWKIFQYCVVDWKGIIGEDDKPLECNDENKKFIFDYVREFYSFVLINALAPLSNVVEKKTS